GTHYSNLAVMYSADQEWDLATMCAERALAITLSLGLARHPNAQVLASFLVRAWQQVGQANKARRLERGDTADLVKIVAEIEAEHRAWVAEDLKNRHFGPPS